ncbi:HGGxSTG domain-containing protein [Methylobacterium persicinum]
MCGAKKRSTGEPCRNVPAKGRNRCRLHGGATPKGDGPLGWHTRAVPTDKLRSAKMKAAKRRKQQARVEAMTPEERARHDEWHRTHKPGSKSARAQGRQNRDARRWLASLGQDTAAAPTPEIAELREARAKISAEIARLEAEGTETPTPGVDEPTGGLFD